MPWPRHAAEFGQLRLTEERRLLYVALTRAERILLLSGHHWGASTAKPAGPSEFLLECAALAEPLARAGRWAPPPDPGEDNPLTVVAAERALAGRPARCAPAGSGAGADWCSRALRRDLAAEPGAEPMVEPARSGDRDERGMPVEGGVPDRSEAEPIRSAGRRM